LIFGCCGDNCFASTHGTFVYCGTGSSRRIFDVVGLVGCFGENNGALTFFAEMTVNISNLNVSNCHATKGSCISTPGALSPVGLTCYFSLFRNNSGESGLSRPLGAGGQGWFLFLCDFLNNSVTNGVLYLDSSQGEMFVDNCHFGGNVRDIGSLTLNKRYRITNCVFSEFLPSVSFANFSNCTIARIQNARDITSRQCPTYSVSKTLVQSHQTGHSTPFFTPFPTSSFLLSSLLIVTVIPISNVFDNSEQPIHSVVYKSHIEESIILKDSIHFNETSLRTQMASDVTIATKSSLISIESTSILTATKTKSILLSSPIVSTVITATNSVSFSVQSSSFPFASLSMDSYSSSISVPIFTDLVTASIGSTDSPTGGGMSIVLIVGVVIGLIFVIFVVILIVIFLKRRKSNQMDKGPFSIPDIQFENTTTDCSTDNTLFTDNDSISSEGSSFPLNGFDSSMSRKAVGLSLL
jgi:hypothetical protein